MKSGSDAGKRAGRLGAALRANLRRRKSAGKVIGAETQDEGGHKETLSRRVDPLAPAMPRKHEDKGED